MEVVDVFVKWSVLLDYKNSVLGFPTATATALLYV